MRHAPGSVAAVVMGTTPAVTAVGAYAFLGERFGASRLAAVALAVAGVVVVNVGTHAAHGSGENIVLGSALVFGAVCCEASYSLMGKRLTAQLSPLTITATATIVATIVSPPPALWDATSIAWSDVTVRQWLAVAWWGAGSMALGSWLWFTGMEAVEGSVAAPFMGAMPLRALALSDVPLGEQPEWIHLVGLVLVLGGLSAVNREATH